MGHPLRRRPRRRHRRASLQSLAAADRHRHRRRRRRPPRHDRNRVPERNRALDQRLATLPRHLAEAAGAGIAGFGAGGFGAAVGFGAADLVGSSGTAVSKPGGAMFTPAEAPGAGTICMAEGGICPGSIPCGGAGLKLPSSGANEVTFHMGPRRSSRRMFATLPLASVWLVARTVAEPMSRSSRAATVAARSFFFFFSAHSATLPAHSAFRFFTSASAESTASSRAPSKLY